MLRHNTDAWHRSGHWVSSPALNHPIPASNARDDWGGAQACVIETQDIDVKSTCEDIRRRGAECKFGIRGSAAMASQGMVEDYLLFSNIFLEYSFHDQNFHQSFSSFAIGTEYFSS